jgi:glycosyltransferase involved in cell wall biosynthesis
VRILILNWRCPRNPRAGGAELLTHEVAKRLVAGGDEVEWFSATYPGAEPVEDLDGIRLVRAGHQWTVHWRAFRHYHGKLQGRFDAVIDQVNTVPFFTPLWAGIPSFMFIHQLAREVWWYEIPFPLNAVGFAAEPWYLRIYRRTPVLTVSPSTEKDLRSLGFSGPISIIPAGLEPITSQRLTKEDSPTFAYVGRLSPSKRVADVIKAFALFRVRSSGQLWIAGNGSARHVRYLLSLINRLGLTEDVHFVGRISNEEKHSLMARAHALVLASAREGWGLVVTEANACGTPAVVYDVPGLRESVRDGETGIVVEPCPRALAEGMDRLCGDEKEYARLATNARMWSSTFSYDATTEAVKQAVSGPPNIGLQQVPT